MIDLSFLKFISAEISDFTGNTILENNLVWSNIIDQDGTVAAPANSIAITLVKIEKESVVNKSNTIYKDNKYGFPTPSLNINLFLQFAAYNNDYGEALKQLGYILSYFQSYPVLTKQNAKHFTEPGIDKLIFEIVNYSHQELSNLWSQLGAKYIPSVVYKMRMIIIDESKFETRPPIIKIDETIGIKK